MEKLYSFFDYVDDKFGPSKLEHKPACYESKEMILECVLSSQCFKEHQNFRYCV